ERDTGPLGRHTAVPWAATAGPPGAGAVLAALVTLERVDAGGALPRPRLAVAAGHITAHWPAGPPTEIPL
ncbi:hypothetical protein EBN88_20040, partial [Streptomyces triticirhizae]